MATRRRSSERGAAKEITGAIGGAAGEITEGLSRIISENSNKIEAVINQVIAFLRKPTLSNEGDVSLMCGYFASVKDSLESRMGKLISSYDISLPSPAAFMEPVHGELLLMLL